MKLLYAIAAAALLAGCDNMQHQGNRRPLTPSPLFADGTSARRPPAHAVPADPEPPGIGAPLDSLGRLKRGQALFNADCAPCHGEDGYGQGIVVLRGFPRPGSLHDPAQRALPNQALYEAISRGKGRMYPYADRLVPEDRWLVVAYIRALQRSQHASVSDVPEDHRKELAGP